MIKAMIISMEFGAGTVENLQYVSAANIRESDSVINLGTKDECVSDNTV